MPCEHSIPIGECDECRYEVGLVKVPQDVAASLLEAMEVNERAEPDHSLRLRCEAGTDRLATAEIAAALGGRIERIVTTLGHRVQVGDVLVVLQSQEAAAARLEHIRAHQDLDLARLDLERVEKVHRSLKEIVAGLGGAEAERAALGGTLDVAAFSGLPAGNQKAKLLVAFNEFQEAARLARIERIRAAEGNRLLGRRSSENRPGKPHPRDLCDLAGPPPAPGACEERPGTGQGGPAASPAGGSNGNGSGPYAGEWRRLLAEARETRDLSRKDKERIEGLVRSGVRSARELDAVRRDVAVAEAAYRAARETVALDVDRLEVQAEASLRSARIRLEGEVEEISLHLEAELARANRAVGTAQADEALAHQALVQLGLTEEIMERDVVSPLPVPQSLVRADEGGAASAPGAAGATEPALPEGKAFQAGASAPAAVGMQELWRLEVKAPVAGTVVKQAVSVGRTVARGEPLLTLSDTRSAWVWCDLYPQDLQVLGDHPLPLPATLDGAGLPDGGVAGNLDYVERSADPHTRTVKARIVVTGDAVRPGTFVSARVAVGEARRGLLLPEESVLSDGAERFVFVRWKGELWAKRDVDVQPAGDGLVRIVSGLDVGDWVAVRGGFFLKSDVLRERMGAGCAD